MINNRQTGRRRGRGGGGRSPNQGNPGNRQDNRSRGNATQLLEKYKSLARDAQMQGDRVQSEYFLQFAEHYYRVLNESRARFEEQRRQRDDYSEDDDDQDEAMNAESESDDGDEDERDVRADRGDRQDRGDRHERGRERPRRDHREERNGERHEGRRARRFDAREESGNGADEGEGAAEGERISLDVLPPAISAGESEAPAKAPRRRTRRPRDGEEIAPAA